MLSRIARSLCSRHSRRFNHLRTQPPNRRLSIHSTPQFERLEERRLLAVDLEWARQFGDGIEESLAVAVGGDGSVYVAGTTTSQIGAQPNQGGSDAFLRKYDSTGALSWTIPFGTTRDDGFTSVVVHDDPQSPENNGLYIGGLTRNVMDPQIGSVNQGFVKEYALNGDPAAEWTRTYERLLTRLPGAYDDAGFHEFWSTGIHVALDGDALYITGTKFVDAFPSSGLTSEAFVEKLTTVNDFSWRREFGSFMKREHLFYGALDEDIIASGIAVVEGHVYVAAQAALNLVIDAGISPQPLIRKYDTAGNIIWTERYGDRVDLDGGNRTDNIEIAADASGVYVFSPSYGVNHPTDGPRNTFLRKYNLVDTTGEDGHKYPTVDWTQRLGDLTKVIPDGVVVNGDHVYVAGTTSPGTTESEVFIRKFDFAGASLGSAVFGTAGEDYGASLAVSGDSIYVVGRTRGQFPDAPLPTALDAYLAKINEPLDTAINVTDPVQFVTLPSQVYFPSDPGIPAVDSDNDGLSDAVDEDDTTFSNSFNDGNTSGVITNRGDQILTVTDAPSPFGVLVSADPLGGTTPATISVDSVVYRVRAGDSFTVTRGSVITQVLSGALETMFLSDTGTVIATASLGAGSEVTFEPETATFAVAESSQTSVEVQLIGTDGQQATATLSAGSELTFNAESFSFSAPPTNAEPVSIVLANGDEVTVEPGQTVVPPTLVQIDIRPGDEPNTLNLASNGKIAVSILSSDTFDARHVIASSVIFAGASMTHSALEDTNGDGRLDLVLHFRTQETNLRSVYEDLLIADGLESSHQTASVSLTGSLDVDGVDELFAGSDEMDLFLAGRALRNLLEELAAVGAI